MDLNVTVKEALKLHLQTAIEIELSTIPIYLYTYYSFMRKPEGCDKVSPDYMVQTFANNAGGVIMSVAIEEMLHMSLASNILRSLGGYPKLYGRSPGHYPTNLLQHKAGFSVGLSELSAAQLGQFLIIESPEAKDAPPEGKDWETLGQFYDYIVELINKLDDSDFQNGNDYQLADGKGYYASSNIDTIYPNNAKVFTEPIQKNPIEPLQASAQYPDHDDSGKLMVINSKTTAIQAITIIKDQGEGNDDTHSWDDPDKKELSHWDKYNTLLTQCAGITDDQWKCFLFGFPDNPTKDSYPEEYGCVIDLVNAVYSYLLKITEVSFTLSGKAQYAMFYIGMHKGMIFILDKLIGNMRYTKLMLNNGTTAALAPTFENYTFKSDATAKEELLELCNKVSELYPKICDANIAQRIHDLPDVQIVYSPEGVATVKF